jgi:hypothetical protein
VRCTNLEDRCPSLAHKDDRMNSAAQSLPEHAVVCLGHSLTRGGRRGPLALPATRGKRDPAASWSLRDTRKAILTDEVHDNGERTAVVSAVHPERDTSVESFEGLLNGEFEGPQLTRRNFRSGCAP